VRSAYILEPNILIKVLKILGRKLKPEKLVISCISTQKEKKQDFNTTLMVYFDTFHHRAPKLSSIMVSIGANVRKTFLHSILFYFSVGNVRKYKTTCNLTYM